MNLLYRVSWDILALALTALFVPLLHMAVRWLLRHYWISRFTGRKLFHVALGTWCIPMALLITHPIVGAALILPLIAMNFRGNYKRIKRGGRWLITLSAALHSLAFIILSVAWFQGNLAALTGAILTMSYGDAAAALAGMAGQNRPGPRTWRGTAANAIVSAMTIGAVLSLSQPLSWWLAPIAIAGGCLAAAVERITPGPLDNPAVLAAIGSYLLAAL